MRKAIVKYSNRWYRITTDGKRFPVEESFYINGNGDVKPLLRIKIKITGKDLFPGLNWIQRQFVYLLIKATTDLEIRKLSEKSPSKRWFKFTDLMVKASCYRIIKKK